MNEDKKMFLCVKSSKYIFHISPQTRSGWLAFGAWTMLILVIAGAYAGVNHYLEGQGLSDSAILLRTMPVFLIILTLVVIIMIRWMYKRSDIVNTQELAAWKKDKGGKASSKNKRHNRTSK